MLPWSDSKGRYDGVFGTEVMVEGVEEVEVVVEWRVRLSTRRPAMCYAGTAVWMLDAL